MKTALRNCLVALLAGGMSLGPLASVGRAAEPGAPKERWAVARLQGMLTVPLGGNSVKGWNDCNSGWFDYLDFYSEIGVNSSAGVLASFEYVVARRYGFEVGFVYWHDIVDLAFETEGFTVAGSPNFIMPTLGVNYHFRTDETKDIYAGALCALGVVATGFFTDIEVSKDVALGLNAGADFRVRGAWYLGGSVKYVDFGEINFSVLPPGMEGFICDNGIFGLGRMNVVTATCGAGYRF